MPKKGDYVNAKISFVRDNGAELKLTTGEGAYLPIREVHKDYVKNIRDYINVGDEVEVKIIGRSKKDYNKFLVSLKQADRTQRFEDMMKKWKGESNDRNTAIQRSRDRKQGTKPKTKKF